MKIIAICDTNIFIDLIEIKLLDEFFALPWEIHTTDMIIHELNVANQKKRVVDYQTRGVLRVKGYDMNEMLTLTKFYSLQRETTKASIQDCSVLLYTMEKGYTLLTGGIKLEEVATNAGIDVHNIIYIIDKLVHMRLLSKETAAYKLEELILLNPRLPMSEIERRVKLWRGIKKGDSL
ncbi:MAG: hypothetical protein IJY36_02070 [Coprobacter sp.]|nr:hypothetical protein [Coprobacter sp.]